jgi:Cof subfamily protein (haloacid dehalogenase superfamily)
MDVQSNKAIKLVAIDLDGTLFNSESKITDRNLKAIHKCLKNGVKVIITTAKTVYWVKKLILELGLEDPQIASAGAVIIDKNLAPVYVKKIPVKAYRKVVKLARQYGVGFGASCLDGFVYYEKHNQLLDYIWDTGEQPKYTDNLLKPGIANQVLLITATVNEEDPFNNAAIDCVGDAIKLRRGGPYFLAGCNKNAGKMGALKKIMASLKINSRNIMAIGDSESDLGMIKLAGIGVAMGNASNVLKANADFTVSGNDNDGVAEAIERFVFDGR